MTQSIRASLILILLLLLPAGYAHPLGLRVEYAINFFPPSPCAETFVGGNSLEGAVMNGGINLFLGLPGRTSDPVASTGVEGLVCGSSLPAVQILDLSVTETTPLYLQFGGSLVEIAHGPPNLPFYAFDEGTVEGSDAVAGDPGSPPSILLGWLEVPPGPPILPLFAFASPGTQIGTLTVHVTPVPEPGTLLLLGAGLAGAAVLRRRFGA
ncbi:MAG: PEP-CTERM sorting domain-containing protein [Nitrospirae bacterium]|nr:PEP-CTERM sorting domain-containing protein [Nitrospirota bacterium]